MRKRLGVIVPRPRVLCNDTLRTRVVIDKCKCVITVGFTLVGSVLKQTGHPTTNPERPGLGSLALRIPDFTPPAGHSRVVPGLMHRISTAVLYCVLGNFSNNRINFALKVRIFKDLL